MHLGQEGLPLAVQFPEEPRQMPVTAIEGHEGEAQAVASQAPHQLQRDLTLGAELLPISTLSDLFHINGLDHVLKCALL